MDPQNTPSIYRWKGWNAVGKDKITAAMMGDREAQEEGET